MKEAGLAGLAVGWLWTIIGFMQMGNAIIECEPNVDTYIISLIIRIVRKPKM